MSRILSTEEIEGFIRDVGINCDQCTNVDRLSLLKKLIRGFQQHVPFTNLPLLAVEKTKRRVKTWDEVKQSVISLEGGLCYELNTFMCVLLTALGFNTYSTVGVVSRDGTKPSVDSHPTHVLTIVENVLDKGDKFLIDVGFGFPVLDPIPLDFDVETDVYQHVHVTCKYMKEGEFYVRKNVHHKDDGPIFSYLNYPSNENWIIDYVFCLKPVSSEEIEKMENAVYNCNSSHLFQQDIVRGAIHPPGKSYAFKVSKDSIVVFEASSGDTKYHVQTLNSVSELQQFVYRNFPNMSWLTLEQVIKQF